MHFDAQGYDLNYLARIGFIALAATLVACQPSTPNTSAQPTASVPSVTAPKPTYANVLTQAAGFKVGVANASTTAYVLFDPQCPHCGQLWQASIPLQSKVQFVWIPVAIMNERSAPQGASLLAASNPLELMQEHEKSIIQGTGGMANPSGVTPELLAKIKNNTQLFKSTGVDSVPFIIVKAAGTSEVITRKGALDTAGLVKLLGIDSSI
jgi:thiol:disulfide interchange protein DsbG